MYGENSFAEGYAIGRDSNNSNGFGFGGDGAWWIIILLLAGWGNGGFGGGRGYGYGGIGENYALATDFATIERKLDGVNNGICDSTFALNNTITTGNYNTINAITQAASGLNTALVQGFNGVDRAICTLGYNQAQLVNGLSREIGDCCCKTSAAIQDVKYANERQTCDLITNANANTQRILDFMVNEKMASKDARIATLEAQISNDRQSRYIVDALSPKCPVSAYVVQPPQQVTFPTNCCGNVAYANYNSSCGCC